MSNWQTLTDFNELWMVSRDPQDSWFTYFDKLSQFELSRHRRIFKETQQAWVFAGNLYFPSKFLLLADFSASDIKPQVEQWKQLGQPKTMIFTDSHENFVRNFIAVAPAQFHHVQGAP